MDTAGIKSTLTILERRVNALGTQDEPPKTVLRVVDESQTEKMWQLLLAYFIEPTEPHGFGTDALEQFLTCISNHSQTSFTFQPQELDDVTVDVEVPADDGRADLLVWVDDSWFICIEVKVDSTESDNQTERYAASESLGELSVASIPPDQRHYIYLADRRARASVAPEFVDVSWKQVTEALDTLRSDRMATYPARSGAQLSEFIDHINHELRMTDDTASYTEKAALALDHQDLLDELDDAVERAVEDVQASWDAEFLRNPPAAWTDEWKAIGGGYGRLLKTDWVLPSNTHGKPKKGDGFAIAFPTEALRENLEDGQTNFKFKVYGGNEYAAQFQDRFYADEFQQRIAPIIDKYGLILEDREHTGRLLKTPYEFEFDHGNGYVDALRQAFQEHSELVPHVEELYFDIRREYAD